jgi:hypothetical protein
MILLSKRRADRLETAFAGSAAGTMLDQQVQ